MLKYIKWELIDYLKKNYRIYIILAIVYLLTIIILYNKTIAFPFLLKAIIIIAFIILVILNIFSCYLKGAEHTINTFKNKTFLLESMLPLSPLKLTIAKYIISMIINLSFIPILALVIYYVVGSQTVYDIFRIIKQLWAIKFPQYSFNDLLIFLSSSSLLFTSLITLSYVSLKSLYPKKDNHRIASYIITYLLFSLCTNFIKNIIGNSSLLVYSCLILLITVLSLYLTVYLITNKLEVYH